MKIEILTSVENHPQPIISMQAESFAEKCMLKIIMDGLEHFGVKYFRWQNDMEDGVSIHLVKKE